MIPIRHSSEVLWRSGVVIRHSPPGRASVPARRESPDHPDTPARWRKTICATVERPGSGFPFLT